MQNSKIKEEKKVNTCIFEKNKVMKRKPSNLYLTTSNYFEVILTNCHIMKLQRVKIIILTFHIS